MPVIVSGGLELYEFLVEFLVDPYDGCTVSASVVVVRSRPDGQQRFV